MYRKLVITTFVVAVAGMLFGMPEISHAASGRGTSTQIAAPRMGPGGPGPRPGGPGPGPRPGFRPGGPGPGPRPGFRPGGPPPPPPYVEHHHHYHDNDAVAVGGAMFLLGALIANGN